MSAFIIKKCCVYDKYADGVSVIKRSVYIFLYVTMIYAVLIQSGCIDEYNADELVCEDGTAWVYFDNSSSRPDGYIFRDDGVFLYIIKNGEYWSTDYCTVVEGRSECGYLGTWTANGSFITFTHEDGRQQRQIRYAMQGNGIMMLYDNGETVPPSTLIKVGNVYVTN